MSDTGRQRARPVRVRRFDSGEWAPEAGDVVAAEDPLEIRVEGQPTAVTMRTPGHDRELTAGFLWTEGVIDGPDDLVALRHVDDPSDPQGNTIDVVLAPGVPALRRARAQRSFFASSSCGICGKAALDAVLQQHPPLPVPQPVPPEVVAVLPARMREAQAVFDQTGGLHAAALCDPKTGEVEVLREDIGRHNAVDKVLGWRLLEDRVPVDDRVLVLSGRLGFEIAQKAWAARIPAIVAVGAPSSLAVELGQRANMVLYGFVRDGRFNQYV